MHISWPQQQCEHRMEPSILLTLTLPLTTDNCVPGTQRSSDPPSLLASHARWLLLQTALSTHILFSLLFVPSFLSLLCHATHLTDLHFPFSTCSS